MSAAGGVPSSTRFTTLMTGLAFGECPRWRAGRLYVSDQHARRVLSFALDGSSVIVAMVAQQPSGMGWLPDGRMLVVSMRDRKILRQEKSGALVVHADVSQLAPWHLNDMVVDWDGRAWVGNFGFDLMGGAPVRDTALVCVEPDGTSQIAAEGLGFPNGMVLTPNGTLIVAETLANRLTAFDVRSGRLINRREWAKFGEPSNSANVNEVLSELAVTPDGICLDAEGAVWVSDSLHARLLRVAEGGKILDELATGSPVFACMLGGDDGKTLFACTAPTFQEEELVANHRASILMTRVEVGHAGLP